MLVNYGSQNHLGLSESTLVFVQHNIGFIKYHNSRTNIYMPACFLTKMAAIGKNDGSEIEQNKTGGLYKWWYCLPNRSTAYTIPLNVIYTYLINPLGVRQSEYSYHYHQILLCTTMVKRKLDCIII